MGLRNRLWKKLTPTKALKESSGVLETLFYESVYRLAYATGLSFSDYNGPYFIYRILIGVMFTLILCGEVAFGCIDALSLDEVVETINVCVIHLLTMCKLKNMMDHKDVYKRLATSMESPFFDITTKERKKLVEFWAATHERCFKTMIYLGSGTLIFWHLSPLVDEVEYNLMVGIHLPFNYNTPFRYFMTYIIITIAFLYTSYCVIVSDIIMQSTLLPIICQFTVLADCFKNIVNESEVGFEGIDRSELIRNKDFTDKYVKRLGNLVHQHKFILNHAMDLRKILSGPMLAQLGASCTLICFVGYQTSATMMVNLLKCFMSIMYLGYNMFSLYIFCRWCEEITIQSQKIGEAMYSSGWESGMAKIPGVKSTIIFIIARANKPLIFTAGGMYQLSLTSYSNLVKTSYSALTVLLRFD